MAIPLIGETVLSEHFPNKSLSQPGLQDYSMQFVVSGCLVKEEVYANKVNSIEEIKRGIREAFD